MEVARKEADNKKEWRSLKERAIKHALKHAPEFTYFEFSGRPVSRVNRGRTEISSLTVLGLLTRLKLFLRESLGASPRADVCRGTLSKFSPSFPRVLRSSRTARELRPSVPRTIRGRMRRRGPECDRYELPSSISSIF